MTDKCANDLKRGNYSQIFAKLYPFDKEEQIKRYTKLLKGYDNTFTEESDCQIRLFSSPGRAEIGGNHTDHQRGRVLAAAVQMDAVAVVAKNKDSVIRIVSEGYGLVEVDITDLKVKTNEINTTAAVIRGVCARLDQLGYTIGGFNAYSNSFVPAGSGLSSSACFENLITTILNELYNEGTIDAILTAQIGKYAENVYFGKPSGLMDQAASSVGGVITIDFKDNQNPVVEPISLDLSAYDYSLCVVITDGDHADLTDDYRDIFNENKEVANFFGKDVLREVEEPAFYTELPELRKLFGDRAVIRAMHFFDENSRVLEQVNAIKNKDFKLFKKLVLESGESSFNRLQNIYSNRNVTSQPISLALEYSRKLLEPVGGAWRVHGGGFAGTILAFVPNDSLEEYKNKMDYIFGSNATQVLAIRPVGSCEVKLNNKN